MAVNYAIVDAINDRLLGVVTAIGAGSFILKSGATTISTISLPNPCGTVSGGVLTFSGVLLDLSAAATGLVNSAIINSSAGVTQISGLTVGIPLSGADIVISNGFNTTLITAGQVVSLASAQITGS